VVDLRANVPPGERLIIVVRTDRLRRTSWASLLDPILAPMPDYRVVVAGTGAVADTFDTIVIATADPRDVTATFVAAKPPTPAAPAPRDTPHSPAAARTSRPAAPAARGEPARVAWTQAPEGSVGRRAAPVAGDDRILVLPYARWFLLVHPGDLAAPGWLPALA